MQPLGAKEMKALSGRTRPSRAQEDKRRRPIEEILEELGAQVPDELWAQLPDDFSEQLDHYIYGLPKRSVR